MLGQRGPRSYNAAVILPALLALLGLGADPAPPQATRDPLDVVSIYVRDVESTRVETIDAGVKLSARFAPDAQVWHVASQYVALRKKGSSHDAAVAAVAVDGEALRKRDAASAVLLHLEKLEKRPRDLVVDDVGKRIVYTLEKALAPGKGQKAEGAVALTAADGKGLTAWQITPAENLRETKIRVKKFWKTADGKGRKGAYDPGDPDSVGRVPVLSKPFAALVLEEKPAAAEVLFKLRGKKPPTLELRDLKRYEGPFTEDQIDLNQGRRWETLKPLRIELREPPGGLEVPQAVRDLVREVSAIAKARKKG